MRFFTYLTAALVPVAAVASTLELKQPKVPYKRQDNNSGSSSSETSGAGQLGSELGSLLNNLGSGDYSGILGSITDDIGTLTQFLNSGFLDDVHDAVTYLSDLLQPPFVNETRGLVDDASSLVNDIKPIFSAISPLISDLSNIDFSGILDSFGSLDIGGLIKSLSGLLSTQNINYLSDIVVQAHNLLTAQFVNQTKGLIADVYPLVEAVSQFVTVLISSLLGD